MFRRIEAKGYKCLREVSQSLTGFEILVGANASGKSTFLDVIDFLGDFVRDGVDVAVKGRTPAFQDLVWGRRGDTFRFSVEVSIPPEERLWTQSAHNGSGLLYGVSIRLDPVSSRLEVSDEQVTLLFSDTATQMRPVIVRSGDRVRYLSEAGNEEYERERFKAQSSLQSIPTDADFPAGAWLRDFFEEGVKKVELDQKSLAKPNPAESANERKISGASLAWQIDRLRADDPRRFEDWICHVRTALPDIENIESVLQQWDNQRFVRIQYANRVQAPAWVISEGTLRLLALTILAYLPDFRGVYLIEEPENGVHPTALETIYQSLSSVYYAQVLIASHSPILLNMASPSQILCFSGSADGTKIVRGSEHPALQDWRNEVSLGTLAASGILG